MLLQRLVEYAARVDETPTLYNSRPVRYIIDLDAAGNLLSSLPTDTANPAERATRRGAPRLVPDIQRSVSIKPLLLADNAEYTLGLARDPTKSARVAECHQAYRALLERCAEATAEPAVQAVVRFLSNYGPDSLSLPADYDRGALVTFQVEGIFPTDLPAVQAFWAAEYDPGASPSGDATIAQCLICGQKRPVLRRLQGKIKGLPGGQTSGTALISANSEAFESYGLRESLIAPTCATCGEQFTKALNHLLTTESARLYIGGSVFLFWTQQPTSFSFQSYLSQPKPEQVRELIASVRTGRFDPTVDPVAFYATALSGSGGRAVVRDWIDTTVAEAKKHLAAWFQRQRIVGPWGEPPEPFGLLDLARATVRDSPKAPPDPSPLVPRALLRSALTAAPLPHALLAQSVRRCQAEQGVTRRRAALIKMVLVQQEETAQEDDMVQLATDNPSPAYRCGRLLAVLEQIQRLAIPGAKATVIDRFYGSASSAPASVFGRLLSGTQPHLSKLERDRPGAHVRLQQQLEEILSDLSGFPRTLTLEDQGLFALGYYHQRAFNRAQAREAAERRKTGQLPLEGADDLAEELDATNLDAASVEEN